MYKERFIIINQKRLIFQIIRFAYNMDFKVFFYRYEGRLITYIFINHDWMTLLNRILIMLEYNLPLHLCYTPGNSWILNTLTLGQLLQATECSKMYRKSVLNLLKYRFALYLNKCIFQVHISTLQYAFVLKFCALKNIYRKDCCIRRIQYM